MSVESILDGALTTLLEKAQRTLAEDVVRPANITFTFTGGGEPVDVTLTDPILQEIPFPCRLVWVHLYALDATGHPIAVDTTVDLQLSQFTSPSVSVPLYGTGTIPTLTTLGLGFAEFDVTDWLQNLTYGDVLTARLATFTGPAVTVALAMQVRPTDVPIGVVDYTDGSGDSYTDAGGDPYVFRS